MHFATSPVQELILSVRTLATPSNGMHRPWIIDAAGSLKVSDVRLDLLMALVRPDGYIPDFLVPTPAGFRETIDVGLGRVEAADPDEVSRQLLHLAMHDRAQAGGGRAARVGLLRDLAAAPREALALIVNELRRYFGVAVAPSWPRIERLLYADLEFRAGQLSSGGLVELFQSLHPRIRFDGGEVYIEKYYDGVFDLGGRGLVLVPSVFAWPDALVSTAEPHAPSLTYSPRGMALLWKFSDVHRRSLAGVLGRTRALVIASLDLPMTTSQLATQFELTAATMSGHLKALQSAGLLVARRDGRSVWYLRTPVADALLDASGAADAGGGARDRSPSSTASPRAGG